MKAIFVWDGIPAPYGAAYEMGEDGFSWNSNELRPVTSFSGIATFRESDALSGPIPKNQSAESVGWRISGGGARGKN